MLAIKIILDTIFIFVGVFFFWVVDSNQMYFLALVQNNLNIISVTGSLWHIFFYFQDRYPRYIFSLLSAGRTGTLGFDQFYWILSNEIWFQFSLELFGISFNYFETFFNTFLIFQSTFFLNFNNYHPVSSLFPPPLF